MPEFWHDPYCSGTGSEKAKWLRTDEDLHSFITRPDLRPPRYNITYHNREKAAPGFFFVAPYRELDGYFRVSQYRTAQVGPHIYDQDGELVWSGARLFNNRPSFAFRPVTINGKSMLSLNVAMADTSDCDYPKGSVILLDDSYRVVRDITYDAPNTVLDLHEFQVIDGSRSALIIGESSVGHNNLNPAGYIGPRADHSIREMDLQSGQALWDWKTTHVVSHSNEPVPSAGSMGRWDATHPNSVAKTSDNNYLVSVRHTDSIYLINGTDNSIIWRLSGTPDGSGSFVKTDDFTFGRQHDARIRAEDTTGMTISFFDNHWKEGLSDTTTSSAMVVKLNTATQPMTAKILQRIWHPDKLISVSAGNFEHLPGGNRLVGWGNTGPDFQRDGYLTEHTVDGELVLQGSMARRFGTYRVFKSGFIGHPTEAPAVRSFSAATTNGKAATVVHVSWNGATEVKTWRVLSSSNAVITESPKKGFETSIHCPGLYDAVAVEGVGTSGNILGRSTLQVTESSFKHDSLDLLVPGNELYSVVPLVTTFLLGILLTGLFGKYRKHFAMRRRSHRAYTILQGDE